MKDSQLPTNSTAKPMIKYETKSGQSINNAAQCATQLARMENQEVEFCFNAVDLRTTPTSNPNDIAEIYALKCELIRARK